MSDRTSLPSSTRRADLCLRSASSAVLPSAAGAASALTSELYASALRNSASTKMPCVCALAKLACEVNGIDCSTHLFGVLAGRLGLVVVSRRNHTQRGGQLLGVDLSESTPTLSARAEARQRITSAMSALAAAMTSCARFSLPRIQE